MNKTAVLKLNDEAIAAWNMHSEEKFVALLDDNATWRINNGNETYRGKREVREYFNRWQEAFPDLHLTVRSKMATEDTVVTEFEFSGTQNGVLHLRRDVPDIEPTHREYRNAGCYVSKVKGGKIMDTNLYTNRMALVEQLGIENELMHHEHH